MKRDWRHMLLEKKSGEKKEKELDVPQRFNKREQIQIVTTQKKDKSIVK